MSRLVEVQAHKRVQTEEQVPDDSLSERKEEEVKVATEFEYFVGTLARKQEEMVEAVDELIRNTRSGANSLEAQYLRDVAKEFSAELQKTGERFRASLAALEAQTAASLRSARLEAEQNVKWLEESFAEDCRRIRVENEERLAVLRARADSELETESEEIQSGFGDAGLRPCSRCGRVMGNRARFCDSCGRKLEG